MDLKRKKNTGEKPETKAGRELAAFMKERGWTCKKIHGNMFQSGLPDWYMYHKEHGQRWVELKMEDGSLTHDQRIVFKDMIAKGVKLWIIRGKEDYQLLFGEPNASLYMTYGVMIFKKMRN